MKIKIYFFIFALTTDYLVQRTCGAVVNISLAQFVDGVLKVPENQEESRIEVNLSEAVNLGNATVTCVSLETAPGLTAVQFIPALASVNTTQVNVTFRILSAGIPVAIQCSAQSQGNNTQFTSSGSAGNTGLLQVIQAPIVYICPEVVFLQKYQLKSSFQVQFSERIDKFAVRVTCSTVESKTDGSPVLQILFEEALVGTNERTAQVSYEIVSLGDPVQVICRAQSTNETLPVPTQPAFSTPVLSSSVNQTSSSVNQTSSPTSSFSVNESSTGLNLTASVATSLSSASSVIATSSPGGISSRSISAVNQYRSSTSAGPAVTFALDLSPLRILPPTGFLRAPNGSFSAVLTLDKPADNTVDITCSLDVVPPSAGGVLRNTTDPCLQPSSGTISLANNFVEIRLDAREIQFQKDEVFKDIGLTLSGIPTQRDVSLLRLACCGQDTGLSLRYAKQTAEAFVLVDVREQQPVDSITTGQRTSDIDLSCPCNLKENSCDAGCCCDQDCSDFESKSSTCISGFFGGATSERPFEFSCQASWPDARTWQPFLCVVIVNSPLIGYFFNFTSPSASSDSASYNSLASTKKREPFSFVESEGRQTTLSGGFYRAGETIKTAANAEDVRYVGATLGVLSLPQPVFNGLCSQTTPVRFLEEFSSRCVLELDQAFCSSQSPWSALNYVMPTKLGRPACLLPPAVLAQGRLNDTAGAPPELANTDVRYYCGDVSAYVSMTPEAPGDLQLNTSSLFGTNSTETPAFERCVFDTGETIPPAPAFNKTTRVCSNVVVRVEYEFKWRERRIDAVMGKVTLGNVQLPALKPQTGRATSDNFVNTLGQTFSVKFLHSPQIINSTKNPIPFERSGNPGYLRGRPVLSRNSENSSGQVTAGKIQLWSPGPNSLCADSALTPVLYGQDTFSGCMLRLSIDDMRNCTLLRELILTNQNRLTQAADIGRRGNATLNNSADWLPVIREPIANNSEAPSGAGICPGIPSGLVIEMLVTEAGKYGGVPQMEIVGTRIRFKYSTWQFRCVSGFGLSCFSVNETVAGSSRIVPSPSASVSENSVNHSIAANRTPGLSVTQTEIASVTQVSNSSVSMEGRISVTPTQNSSVTQSTSPLGTSVSVTRRSVVNNTGTRLYERQFQYFMITSSVVFIKVPAEKPPRVKRTADLSGICHRDVCKEELFFPLTKAYQGEPHEKTVALSLILIFLALVIFAVTRPWG